MTVEQREKRIHELNEQSIAIRNELRTLEKEERKQKQQDCLQWVGRAFKTENYAFLITSVPPIQSRIDGENFNPYQYPCIRLRLCGYSPPVFDETVFINEGLRVGCLREPEKYEEIPAIEFHDILNQRIADIVKLAATAKMRQQGHEVIGLGNELICK